MRGKTGHLPGQDIFQPGFKNCFYGRKDGMFAGMGRFSSLVYMRMFLTRTISPGTMRDMHMHGEILFNILSWQPSCPISHINSP